MTDAQGVDPSALAAQLAAAKAELQQAEVRLEAAMREVRMAPRAEKTTISTHLEEAFARMRLARKALVAVEVMFVGPS